MKREFSNNWSHPLKLFLYNGYVAIVKYCDDKMGMRSVASQAAPWDLGSGGGFLIAPLEVKNGQAGSDGLLSAEEQAAPVWVLVLSKESGGPADGNSGGRVMGRPRMKASLQPTEQEGPSKRGEGPG